jgi:hypothetical protein
MNQAQKIFLLLVIGTFHFSQHALEPTMVLNGSVDLHNQSFNSLIINGAASLEHVTVFDMLQVNGACSAEDCTLHDFVAHGGCSLERTKLHTLDVYGGISCTEVEILGRSLVSGGCCFTLCTLQSIEVHGGFSAHDTQILGKATIYGGVSLQKSHVQDVQVVANSIHCDHSEVNSIYMKQHQECTGFWKLLSYIGLCHEKVQRVELQDTQVYGDIVFEKVGGVVICKGACEIKGKIIGGTLIKSGKEHA